MAARNKIVAYFDFDGTLSTKDTLIPFLLYCTGVWRFSLKLPQLLWVGLLYGLKIIDNQEAKQRTLTQLLKGWKAVDLEQKAKSFALTHLNKYLKPQIYAKLEWHREQGHVLILVSANLAVYLRYFAKLHKINGVIATEIVEQGGVISGRLATPNCYAGQKVLRIQDYLHAGSLAFDYSYAYGNSRGDYEMLELVDEPYYVSGDEFMLYTKSGIEESLIDE